AFDLGFLRRELPVDENGSNGLPDIVIDTLAIARRCYRFPSNRLEHIGDNLRLMGRDRAHRAMADTQATWKLLNWFIADMRDRGVALDTLGDVRALQGKL